jgi:hypothetical protein
MRVCPFALTLSEKMCVCVSIGPHPQWEDACMCSFALTLTKKIRVCVFIRAHPQWEDTLCVCSFVLILSEKMCVCVHSPSPSLRRYVCLSIRPHPQWGDTCVCVDSSSPSLRRCVCVDSSSLSVRRCVCVSIRLHPQWEATCVCRLMLTLTLLVSDRFQLYRIFLNEFVKKNVNDWQTSKLEKSVFFSQIETNKPIIWCLHVLELKRNITNLVYHKKI